MLVKEIFENIIFPDLKKYVEETSIYKPKLIKNIPQKSKVFPIATVILLPFENRYNNLSYGELTYDFGIDINCYAQDITENNEKISKKTVCNEVVSKVVEFFEKNYHVRIKVELDIKNIDSNIHRDNVRITGRLDTKYGLDKLVIYPN